MDWYVIVLKDRTYGVIVLSDYKPREDEDIALEPEDPDEPDTIFEAGEFDVVGGPLPEADAHQELDRWLVAG